jgi:UDP-glucose 4-epimerase
MKYLVTGGCGFIGQRLIARLMSGGAAVRVVDNLETGRLAAIEAIAPATRVGEPAALVVGRIEIIVGDVTDAELAIAATKQVDAVVHLAANTGIGPSIENPRRDCLSNVLGTFNYLEGCRVNGVRRFVLASSSAAVGEQEPPISETAVPRPMSPYAASKLAAEGYCSAYAHSFEIVAVSLRFGNVYGPGSEHKESVVAKFIRRALKGEALEVYGDGSQTRDFIYIDDLVEAIIAAIQTENVAGEVFQIASARETTVSEIAAKLMDAVEAAGVRRVELQYLKPRTGDVRRSYADTSKALRILNWRATTSLDHGLQRTLQWFLDSEAAARTRSEARGVT